MYIAVGNVSFDSNPDEPIDDEIPIADALEQRLEVGSAAPLSETFEPTEASEIASGSAPLDADPADWQEQQTAASEADGWDDVDR